MDILTLLQNATADPPTAESPVAPDSLADKPILITLLMTPADQFSERTVTVIVGQDKRMATRQGAASDTAALIRAAYAALQTQTASAQATKNQPPTAADAAAAEPATQTLATAPATAATAATAASFDDIF